MNNNNNNNNNHNTQIDHCGQDARRVRVGRCKLNIVITSIINILKKCS